MSALSVLYIVLPFPLAFIMLYAEKIGKDRTKSNIIKAIEELIIVLIVTACVLVRAPLSTMIWAAMAIAFSTYLLYHIGKAIIKKKYIPGLVSSIILLPYSFYCIKNIWDYFSLIEFAECIVISIIAMFFMNLLGEKIK